MKAFCMVSQFSYILVVTIRTQSPGTISNEPGRPDCTTAVVTVHIELVPYPT